MYSSLYQQLQHSPQHWVITANERLARHLRQGFEQAMQQQGQLFWETPTILSLNGVLNRLYQNGLDAGFFTDILLSPLQTQMLWVQIVEQYDLDNAVGNALLNPATCAQQANDAWTLLQQWQVPLSPSRFNDQEETLTFLRWAKQFTRQCQQRQWIDEARLPHALSHWLQHATPSLPETIQLVGFYDLPPNLRRLFELMEKQGCAILHYHLPPSAIVPQKAALSDTEEELLAMGHWAEEIYRQHPSAVIGCIIPQLVSIRPLVQRVFAQFFPEPHRYNISGGEPLAQVPIIHSALTLLTLNAKTLPLNQLSRLLLSPYVGYGQSRMTQRARWDRALRKTGNEWLTHHELTRPSSQACHEFQQMFKRVMALCQQQPSQQSPSQWAIHFQEQVTLWEWPGERPLNSEEFQAHESWKKLLIAFASLDRISPLLSRREALEKLNSLAANTLFQPQTTSAPIQALGMLEAIGLPFTHLWVMNLHGKSWPPPANPNPFLPLDIQLQGEMPHSSAVRELKFCRYVMEHFQCSTTQELIYSYPTQEADQTLLESSLLKMIPQSVISLPNMSVSVKPHLEQINDFYAPPIASSESIHGGTAIFKEQAACPFRAFVKIRLGGEPMEKPQAGLTPIEQGTLVHELLEKIWGELGDLTTLLNASDETLNALLDNSVTEGLTSLRNKHQTVLGKTFFSIEHERLTQLLSRWLTYEKEHRIIPFKVIARESKTELTLGGLTINIKLDRLDELYDGSYCLVDYKTGKVNPSQWFGERPEEPQLLLYCFASQHAINGLLFASLKLDDLGFKGITEQEDAINRVPGFEQYKHEHKAATWPQQVDLWKNQLEKLAEQFCQGFAVVDPKTPETCKQCEIHSICRIAEINNPF